jgi:peptide/nickel transport system ATP-binding protein
MLAGEDVLAMNPGRLRAVRWTEAAVVFQGAQHVLNPVQRISRQIKEAIDTHRGSNKVTDLLEQVGIPRWRSDAYPHELSGGQKQRVMIAMALACDPELLIADEPTTALDVTTEAQILELMRDLQNEIGMSIMFITHNLGVVAQMCDEVAVMYLGRVVEWASINDIFYEPKHPYTISLLRSIPRLGSSSHIRLESIKGSVPDPYSSVTGCPFHPRCPSHMPGLCDVKLPEEIHVDGNPRHTVRCHLYS